MYPTFGDVDGDGDLDMYIGDLQGRIHFYRNTATGPIAQFTLAEATVSYQDGTQIDVGRQATPQFVDLDRDGRIDLVVGEQNGNLNYIRNVGSNTAPTWTLANDSLGHVRTVTLYTLGHSTPFIFQNPEGNYELLAGSESGTLWHYTNIDGNLDGAWTLADTSFLDIYEGYRATVCLHDYTGDGQLDTAPGWSTGRCLRRCPPCRAPSLVCAVGSRRGSTPPGASTPVVTRCRCRGERWHRRGLGPKRVRARTRGNSGRIPGAIASSSVLAAQRAPRVRSGCPGVRRQTGRHP